MTPSMSSLVTFFKIFERPRHLASALIEASIGIFSSFFLETKNTKCFLEVHIPIVLFLSGDWKFIAIVMGLKSASALEGFCIWCTAQKNDLATKDVFRARSLDEVLKAFSNGRCTIPGQERVPLFDFIPFDRVIIDPLHAFLRISEKLIDLAFEEVISVLILLHSFEADSRSL